jgi:hypothetical protein
MKLNMGEIGNLITALDCALKSVEVLMRSELPAGDPRSWWKAQDRENYRMWRHDLKVFRRLRRKLHRVEDAAIAAHRGTRPSRSRRAPTLLISIDKPD